MDTSVTEVSTRAAAEVSGDGASLLVPCLQPAMRAGPCRPAGRNTMPHVVPAAGCPVVGCRLHCACAIHVACRMFCAACCMLHAARCNGPSGRCLLGVVSQLGDRRLCFLEIETGRTCVDAIDARGTRPCIGPLSPALARRLDAAEAVGGSAQSRLGAIAPAAALAPAPSRHRSSPRRSPRRLPCSELLTMRETQAVGAYRSTLRYHRHG